MHGVPLMINLRVEGDKVYLLFNYQKIGYWTVENISQFREFVDAFLRQRAKMSEVVLPQLERGEDCDPAIIESERAARSYALIEAAAACAVRAEEIRAAARALPGRGALIQRAEHDARASEMDVMAMFLRARAKGGE